LSAASKIRIGAAIVIAGELASLLTQEWARASTFLGFVLVSGGLLAAGAVLATWGVIQIGQRS
jgi:hypothetical protein